MKYSLIQKIMIDKITEGDSKIKLEDFYDAFSYDLIDEDIEKLLGNNYNKIEHKVTYIDVIKVANALIIRDLLSYNEIYSFVLYLNDIFKPSLMNNNDFKMAYDSICDKLRYEIAIIDSKIKNNKNQAKVEDEKNSIDKRIDIANEKKKELSGNRAFIKISINELEKIKLILKLNTPLVAPKNKKEKQHKKQEQKLLRDNNKTEIDKPIIIDERVLVLHRRFKELSLNIDDKNISDEKIQSDIIKLVNSIDKKDSAVKNDIIQVLKKLRIRLKQEDKDYNSVKKEINNLNELLNEYNNIEIISDDALEEYIENKKILKTTYSLLESITKDIELSSKDLRAAITNGRKSIQNENLYDAKQSVVDIKNKNGFLDLEMNDKDYSFRLGSYSEQQPYLLSGYAEKIFDNYKPEDKYINAFYLKNALGKPINHNYVFSIERMDNQTIVRMHVLNIYPKVLDAIKGFWLENYYKQFDDQYNEDVLLDNYLSQKFAFKLNKIVPTIAYKFTFDKDYQLSDFDVEQKSVKVKEINSTENTILENIYDINNTRATYNSLNAFFEDFLKAKFIDYATVNNLPIIYYGRYNIDQREDVKSGKKVDLKMKNVIGYQTMDEKSQVLSEILKDYPREDFNSVCRKWCSNYRMKHFSMDYKSDFRYFMTDLGIINPASFMGNNLQMVINEVVLANQEERKNKDNYLLREEQKQLVATLNKVCGYIELDDFIQMVANASSTNNNSKKKF